MAEIYGKPGKEIGDQNVYRSLHYLPDDYLVYAQPVLVCDSDRCYPDYVVLHKDIGVLVLEVKDWVRIELIDRVALRVFRTQLRRWEDDSSPVEIARSNSIFLKNLLIQNQELRNFAGKLDFPYSYAAVLPQLDAITINNCKNEWGVNYVLGQADLSRETILERIKRVPRKFQHRMSDAQLGAVRAIIDGRNKLTDKRSGEFKGVLDATQESIAKEGLEPAMVPPNEKAVIQGSLFSDMFPKSQARRELIRNEAPDEVIDLQSDLKVRLVRGFAGTGKTDLLILRAQYLSEQYEKLKILVTTFNNPLYQKRLVPELADFKRKVDVIKFDTLCAKVFKKQNQVWRTPQSTQALLNVMARENKELETWGIEFLADEFIWMKESGRTDRNKYTSHPREGRRSSSGKTLSASQKDKLFDIFLSYEKRLKNLPAFDWADMHNKTFDFLRSGTEPDKKYNVILIDEAQHFAPVWIKIIKRFLEPGGVLFLCDDPSQSVFRFFSWHQKGIEVVGRTRWLKVPYRCTREIFTAAFKLISEDENAKSLLSEDKNFAIPDLDNPNLRKGKKPLVKKFESIETEKAFIYTEIAGLVKAGMLPEEICIMHTQQYVRSSFDRNLIKGVNVESAISQTGMEYKAVFIPRVQNLYERKGDSGWEDDQSIARSSFFTLMTRAKSHLYMTYEQNWPKALEVIRPHVNWEEE